TEVGNAALAFTNTTPPYAFSGFRRWFDAEGYPAIQPPWGTLNAVDLNTGEIKWKVPLGEYPTLKARGSPPTGTENYGGPLVTAGGLIFIGATADETFRAFDKHTGAGRHAVRRQCQPQHLYDQRPPICGDLRRGSEIGSSCRRQHRRVRASGTPGKLERRKRAGPGTGAVYP